VIYTPDELRHMAIRAEQARTEADPRYLLLVMQLSLRTGLDQASGMRGISQLARTGNTASEERAHA